MGTTETNFGFVDDNEVRVNALRFSLASVQLKLSDATGGLTIPATGAGGFRIIKLQSREYDGVPENEFSMMKRAAMMGM
jgi:serine/threonine-protein kinase HipA